MYLIDKASQLITESKNLTDKNLLIENYEYLDELYTDLIHNDEVRTLTGYKQLKFKNYLAEMKDLRFDIYKTQFENSNDDSQKIELLNNMLDLKIRSSDFPSSFCEFGINIYKKNHEYDKVGKLYLILNYNCRSMFKKAEHYENSAYYYSIAKKENGDGPDIVFNKESCTYYRYAYEEYKILKSRNDISQIEKDKAEDKLNNIYDKIMLQYRKNFRFF